MTSVLRGSFLVGLFSILAFSTAGISQENSYRSPDYAHAASVLRSYGYSEYMKASPLAQDLVGLAIKLDDFPDLRSKCLALAWFISGPRSYDVIARAEFYFRIGEIPEDDGAFENLREISTAEAFNEVYGSTKALHEYVGDDANVFVGLVYDVLVETTERGATQVKLARSFKPEKSAEYWNEVMPSEGKGEPGSTLVMGGKRASSQIVPRRFSRDQATVNGLLVVSLAGGEFAGGVAKMNATVNGTGGTRGKTIVTFSQGVGKMMKSALEEAAEFVSLKHSGFPSGYSIRISFQERDSLKDGPSGAVACALLLNSLLVGSDLDSSFAVTGDMNADGKVQPVGGIDGKIRGAARKGCTYVAIPAANRVALQDMAILGDFYTLANIQVFSQDTFDDAWSLALNKEDRPDNINEAMRLFDEVKAVVKPSNVKTMLSNVHVRERLQKVLELAPNHESARILFAIGNGKMPGKLSLAGSFTAIDRSARPLLNLGRSRNVDSTINSLKDASLDLKRIRNFLDPRTKDAADATDDLVTALSQLGNANPSKGSARYNEIVREIDSAVAAIDAAYAKLRSDPAIQAELLF